MICIGLGDAKDITVKGLEIVMSANQVFLESYTSVLSVGEDPLVSILSLCAAKIKFPCTQENFYRCELILADRELVEQNLGTLETMWR